MFKKHHTTTLNFLLAIGIFVYLFFVLNNNLPMAIISLVLFLYVWILGKSYYKIFNIYDLLHKTGYIGILLAITYFFMFGIEEVPYPEGAILFHPQDIALSLLILIISNILVLYSNDGGFWAGYKYDNCPPKGTKTSPQTENVSTSKAIQKEKWEEATLEDLESGNFEPA